MSRVQEADGGEDDGRLFAMIPPNFLSSKPGGYVSDGHARRWWLVDGIPRWIAGQPQRLR